MKEKYKENQKKTYGNNNEKNGRPDKGASFKKNSYKSFSQKSENKPLKKSADKAASGTEKNEDIEKLSRGLSELSCPELDFTKDDKLIPKIKSYIKEIILFNSAYNLTNTSDFNEIVVNHILDSLSAASSIKKLTKELEESLGIGSDEKASDNKIQIADIGSGGGLPGIPLALTLPEFNFTLVERMDKRCAFLENQAAILGLKNTKVLKSEAEKVPAESFDLVTFRAFRPLDKDMITTLLNLTKKGGIIAAYKAKEKSITQEMEGIKDIVPDYQVIPLTVPFLDEHERNLVVIRKK